MFGKVHSQTTCMMYTLGFTVTTGRVGQGIGRKMVKFQAEIPYKLV